AAGQTTFTTSALSPAAHSITAVYSGDANYNISTSPVLTQTVSKSDTATALSSSVNPTTYGQPIIFTANVTAIAPGSGTPTGTVSFVDGATTLATRTLSAGQAAYTNSSLTASNHTITAVYNGNPSFNPSTSPAVLQTVNKADTITTLTTSANPSVFGQSI